MTKIRGDAMRKTAAGGCGKGGEGEEAVFDQGGESGGERGRVR